MEIRKLTNAGFSICLVWTLTCTCNILYGQNDWSQKLATNLTDFQSCEAASDDQSCQKYIGMALQSVYNVNDFYISVSSRYMFVNEITDFLKDSDQWTLLGYAYEQTALTAAQKSAAENKAVVAVYVMDGVGQLVTLILPGDLQPSGSWRLQVPNSASFFTHDPDKSYVNKGLSYAFGKNMLKDVLVYTRKK